MQHRTHENACLLTCLVALACGGPAVESNPTGDVPRNEMLDDIASRAAADQPFTRYVVFSAPGASERWLGNEDSARPLESEHLPLQRIDLRAYGWEAPV